LNRAHQDLVELDRAIRAYENPLPIKVTFEADLESGKVEARALIDGHVPEVDSGLAVSFGHIVHDLRCALDYLAHELTALGEGRWDKSQFPLADSDAQYTRRDKDTLKRLTPKHRALVERLQPRNTRNFELATLRDLSNRDKHRLLIAHVTTADFSDAHRLLDLVGTHNVRNLLPVYIDAGGLHANAQFAFYRGEITGPDPQVYVKHALPVQVALEETAWRAVDVLKAIRTKIRQAVEEVAQDFPA